MDKLKILSYNCKGLKMGNKRRKVLQWANSIKFDILALQESHFEDCDRDKWEADWDGFIYSSCGSNNSRGVTILIRKELNCIIEHKDKDDEGRWAIIKFKALETNYTLASYYGPNSDDNE